MDSFIASFYYLQSLKVQKIITFKSVGHRNSPAYWKYTLETLL
jgi:hypothetical protein